MDKGKGKEAESSNERFDLNKSPEEEKDDENFPQSSSVNEKSGLKNKEVVNDVTDHSVEQNPDVKSGNMISGQTGSSSLRAMPLNTNDSARHTVDAPIVVFEHLNLPVYERTMGVWSTHDVYSGYWRPPTVPVRRRGRPPLRQIDGHRGVNRDPSMRNSNTVGEQGGRVGEASDSGELGSGQDKSQQNDEDGSTSRDAKRLKR